MNNYMKTISIIKQEAEKLDNNEYMDYIMDEYLINKCLKKSEYKDELISVLDKQHSKNLKKIDPNLCTHCNSPIYIIDNGYLTCNNCGYTTKAMLDDEYIPTYREFQDIEIVPHYEYKRVNHFKDWLNSIQGKENTKIPSNILKSIKDRIKKTKLDNLDYNNLRSILKSLDLSKYYENISLIMNIINSGNPQVLCLTNKQEDILINKFKEIQASYEKYRPSDRKNFLSYSFILRKLCILEKYDNMLKYIPELKDFTKVSQQNIIWAKICKDLKWPYIPNQENSIMNYINYPSEP